MRHLRICNQVTDRRFTSLEKYLHEIARIDLITTDEEVALTQRIKQGDTTAMQKMVLANLRFVVSVSKQYLNQGISLADLINEGNVGLIKAVSRFDETRGFKFISYAVWWIRQSILQAIAEQSRMVRLPLNKVAILHRLNVDTLKLEQHLERHPEPEEIAELTGMPSRDLRELLKAAAHHVSVDVPVSNDLETTIADNLEHHDGPAPDKGLIHESLRLEIHRALMTLSLREADILRYSFGLDGQRPETLFEIARKYGLSCERIRQIRENALRRLKYTSRSKVLKTYLE